jgi:PAS domain S-box-containing protein
MHLLSPSSSPYPLPLSSVRAGALAWQVLLGVVALVASTATVIALLRGGIAPAALPRLLWVPLVAAVAVAIGALLAWRGRFNAGIVVALFGVYAGATLLAVVTSIGVHAVALAQYGIVVLVAAAALGPRALVAFGLLCAASLVGLYVAEVRGLLAGMAAMGDYPPVSRLGTQFVVLVAGGAFGLVLAQALKASLQSAREQQRRFEAMLNIAADWYWEQDAQLRFTHVSDGMRAALGPTEAVLGRTRWELPGAQDSGVDWDAHRADLAARRPFRNLLVRRSGADGAIVWASISGEPQFDPRGRFAGYWGVARDVTAEVQAQRARELSERRFRELFDRTPSAVILHRRGRVVLVNQAAVTLFGYPSAPAMAGLALTQLNHAESRAFSAQRIAALEDMPVGASVPTAEIRMQRADGGELFVQAFVTRIELIDGLASMSMYFDVTERRAAEARLRYSEAMLARLFDVTPDYTTVSELDSGRLRMVNGGFTRLTGFAREEAVGRTAFDLGIWYDAEHRSRVVDEVNEHGVAIDVPVTLRRRDGRLHQCLMSAAPFTLDGAAYLVAIARDITQREHERLQYEAILTNASIGIAVTVDRRFVLANPRFEAMLGWPRGAIVGQSARVAWLSDDDYAEVGAQAAQSLALGRSLDLERRVARRDGSSIWCRMRAGPIDPSDPVNGGTVWIVEDVTERRQFQQRLADAKEQAEAASRAKSEFLANTSHEIRTPLNGLVGLARLAVEHRGDARQQREYLRLMLESAESLSAIISDILDLSKIEAGKLVLEDADFDLHALLSALHAGYREMASSRGLSLQLSVGARVPARVRGDALRTRQILVNFLSNALKFTPAGGVTLAASVADDGALRLSVTDSGPGIDADTRARLFEPFTQADASTTRRFGGTGLGLSICRQLAQLMGGRIGVDSAAGAGSCFWVELPLPVAAAAAASPPVLLDARAPLAGLRVLIVEDNPVNLLIAETFVAGWGAQVSTAGDGRQALDAIGAAAADAGPPFDVVLMDMHMPVMSGYDAIAALRQRFTAAALPIIALTAAALTAERERALQLGANDFITKPIDAPQLLKALSGYLRNAPPPRG